jgi:MFS family permease
MPEDGKRRRQTKPKLPSAITRRGSNDDVTTEGVATPTLFEAAYKIRGVLSLNFMYWALNWVDSDILGGYWRSLVVCRSAISPEATHSADWSGSVHCTDKDFVVAKITSFGASATLISYITRSFSMIILGVFADTYGRKKAILISW